MLEEARSHDRRFDVICVHAFSRFYRNGAEMELTIRKLRFLDGAVDQLENTNSEDLRAELDARFALMTGELSRFLPQIVEALGGEVADEK